MLSSTVGLYGLYSQSENQTDSKDCGIENVFLKTERIEKERKFLFWKLSHQRIKVTGQVVDSNGNIILQRKSAFMCSLDACDYRRFRRIKIVDGEIWVFRHNRKAENEFIERFNLCGKFVGKRKWEAGDFYEDLK